MHDFRHLIFSPLEYTIAVVDLILPIGNQQKPLFLTRSMQHTYTYLIQSNAQTNTKQ